MNLKPIYAAMPSGDRLHELNPYQRKKAVEDAIQVVITAIEKDHVNPDHWESEHLLLALGAVLRAQYWLALQCLQNALEPLESRSPDATFESDAPWASGQLERTLQAVRAAPAN